MGKNMKSIIVLIILMGSIMVITVFDEGLIDWLISD